MSFADRFGHRIGHLRVRREVADTGERPPELHVDQQQQSVARRLDADPRKPDEGGAQQLREPKHAGEKMRDHDERQQHSVILPELPFRVPIKPEEPVGQCPEILVILVHANPVCFVKQIDR